METFEVSLLKTKGIPASDLPNCEGWVNLRIIQDNLGHGSARTTQIYTHLTREVRATLTDPLNQLLQGL